MSTIVVLFLAAFAKAEHRIHQLQIWNFNIRSYCAAYQEWVQLFPILHQSFNYTV
jgi:hypothetical protein